MLSEHLFRRQHFWTKGRAFLWSVCAIRCLIPLSWGAWKARMRSEHSSANKQLAWWIYRRMFLLTTMASTVVRETMWGVSRWVSRLNSSNVLLLLFPIVAAFRRMFIHTSSFLDVNLSLFSHKLIYMILIWDQVVDIFNVLSRHFRVSITIFNQSTTSISL